LIDFQHASDVFRPDETVAACPCGAFARVPCLPPAALVRCDFTLNLHI
jgi:hypothetical protein